MRPFATARPARAAAVALRLAVLLAAAGLLAPARLAAEPVIEEIGTWRLICLQDRMTDRSECLLRHRDPVDPGGPNAAPLTLEAVPRNGRLVPAIAVRELTLETASRGLLAVTGTAQLRFPPNRLFEMPCGLEGRSLICAPQPEDIARASGEFAAARTVLVRMLGFGAFTAPFGEPVELPLAGTEAALARLRTRVPEGGPAEPPPSGLDMRDIMQRLMRLLGY